MIRRPPRSTRTDTLFPYTTLFRSLSARPGHDLLDLRIPAPLPVPAEPGRRLHTILDGDGTLRIVGFDPATGDAVTHASGRLAPAGGPVATGADIRRPDAADPVDTDAIYAAMRQRGVEQIGRAPV